MEPNLVWLLLVALLASKSWGHEYYSGQCPQFPPMKNFLWEKFAPGTWFVTRKTGTTSSCLTYKFAKDQNGFRSVRQARQLLIGDTLGIDHEYIYTGELSTPEEWSLPAKMVAKFPLNPLGSSSYIVLATDYISSGLLCTCQELNVLSLFYVHRVSCSLLQRKPKEDPDLTEKMENVLLSTGLPFASDFASHLNKITQDDHCKYGNTSIAMEI